MKTIKIIYSNRDVTKTVCKSWNKFAALNQLKRDPSFVRVVEL